MKLMKRNVIISGIAVLAVSTGIISYMVSANSQEITPEPQQNSVERVIDQEVVEETTKQVEAPVASPEASQVAESIQEEPTSSESNQVSETQTTTLARNEVLGLSIDLQKKYDFSNRQLNIRSLYGVILLNYDKKPELFTKENATSVINSCYKYLDNMQPERVSINISTGECGL